MILPQNIVRLVDHNPDLLLAARDAALGKQLLCVSRRLFLSDSSDPRK